MALNHRVKTSERITNNLYKQLSEQVGSGFGRISDCMVTFGKRKGVLKTCSDEIQTRLRGKSGSKLQHVFRYKRMSQECRKGNPLPLTKPLWTYNFISHSQTIPHPPMYNPNIIPSCYTPPRLLLSPPTRHIAPYCNSTQGLSIIKNNSGTGM
jgi:hypothetical protein